MAQTKTTPALRDGKYIGRNAVYYVKDGKVIANIKGAFYQFDALGMFGAVFSHSLTTGQAKSFDGIFRNARKM